MGSCSSVWSTKTSKKNRNYVCVCVAEFILKHFMGQTYLLQTWSLSFLIWTCSPRTVLCNPFYKTFGPKKSCLSYIIFQIMISGHCYCNGPGNARSFWSCCWMLLKIKSLAHLHEIISLICDPQHIVLLQCNL